MSRIAFFGGSFDPPHRGHLAVARAAADRFELDQVLFAPVAHQPLKKGQQVTPFQQRYAMVALATQADARFVPSLLDAPREGHPDEPNYTLTTLHHLRKTLNESNQPAALYVLLGADSWLTISRWHGATDLLAMTDWIVAARPGFSLSDAASVLPPRVTAQEIDDSSGRRLILHHQDSTSSVVHFLPYLKEDVAARGLREAVHGGHLDPATVPPAIADYVRKTGLYGAK